MNEKQFRDGLHEFLKKRLFGYNVVKGENLLYRLMIDSHGKLQPESKALTDPKRGQLAFQTDILVRNDTVPLVVVELKVGGFSTHDVLTYSTKARALFVRLDRFINCAFKLSWKLFVMEKETSLACTFIAHLA